MLRSECLDCLDVPRLAWERLNVLSRSLLLCLEGDELGLELSRAACEVDRHRPVVTSVVVSGSVLPGELPIGLCQLPLETLVLGLRLRLRSTAVASSTCSAASASACGLLLLELLELVGEVGVFGPDTPVLCGIRGPLGSTAASLGTALASALASGAAARASTTASTTHSTTLAASGGVLPESGIFRPLGVALKTIGSVAKVEHVVFAHVATPVFGTAVLVAHREDVLCLRCRTAAGAVVASEELRGSRQPAG